MIVAARLTSKERTRLLLSAARSARTDLMLTVANGEPDHTDPWPEYGDPVDPAKRMTEGHWARCCCRCVRARIPNTEETTEGTEWTAFFGVNFWMCRSCVQQVFGVWLPGPEERALAAAAVERRRLQRLRKPFLFRLFSR